MPCLQVRMRPLSPPLFSSSPPLLTSPYLTSPHLPHCLPSQLRGRVDPLHLLPLVRLPARHPPDSPRHRARVLRLEQRPRPQLGRPQLAGAPAHGDRPRRVADNTARRLPRAIGTRGSRHPDPTRCPSSSRPPRYSAALLLSTRTTQATLQPTHPHPPTAHRTTHDR